MVERLEVAWTLAVVGLIAGVGVYSTILVYQIDALTPNPNEYVDVTGHQWYWEFCYPANRTCFNSTYSAPTNSSSLGTVSGGELWAQPGWVVQLNITSSDVVHSFNIPQLGIRLDAIPGRMNSIDVQIPSTAPVGTLYLIQCTEFCGTFHGTMRSFLQVV
jgi:cytochrome c oxidase subunit II